MKKGLKILLLSVLAVPFVAKADMAAPTFRGYDAIITKAEGIKACDYNDNCITIKNGEKVLLNSSGMIDEGEKVSYYITYNGKEYEANLTSGSFKPFKEEVSVTDSDIIDLKHTVTVTTLKEVEIRKGPGVAYESVGKIPANTKVTYQYYTEAEDGGITHIYVDYNGKSGWVETLYGKVLFPSEFYALTYKDYKASCGTVKSGTIVKAKGITDPWSGKVLYTSDKCEFYESTREYKNISDINPRYVTALKDIKIYASFANTKKEIATIKKGEEFINMTYYDDIDGESASAAYVIYGNVKGYAKYSHEDVEFNDEKKVEYKTVGLEEPVNVSIVADFVPYDIENKNDNKDSNKEEVKETKKEEKKDDKKDNKKDNNCYLIIGIAIGSVLVIGAGVVALLKRRK